MAGTPPGSSGFGYRSSTSRRSFPNLQHASLAPLSSRFPMDDDQIDQDYNGDYQARQPTPSAYISGKSAPPTPGILSRGSSPTRRQGKKKKKSQHSVRYSHESFFPSEASHGIGKAKSTSALLASDRSTGANNAGDVMPGQDPRFQPKSRSTAPGTGDEWMHRAGLAITSEARLTKGQSWLASRASSTSLNLMSPSDEYFEKRQQKIALLSSDPSQFHVDPEGVPSYFHQYTPKTQSRQQSRAGSRTASRSGSAHASRAQSRRGSKVGSRNDLIGLTPMPDRENAFRDVPGYFDAVDASEVGPDFVLNEQDEDDTDQEPGKDEDSEVARLARRQRNAGISGIVDKFIGFTLFNVDEDGETETSSPEMSGEETKEQAMQRKEAATQRRREQLQRTASHCADSTSRSVHVPPPPAPEGTGGEAGAGWKDAAWLLSVASKILY